MAWYCRDLCWNISYYKILKTIEIENAMDGINVKKIVLSSLDSFLLEIYGEDGSPVPSLDESTRLIGSQGVLTSLELVTFLVNIEQKLSDDCDIDVTIANERAMSQEKSPFRTIGSLADYVTMLVDEQQNHA